MLNRTVYLYYSAIPSFEDYYALKKYSKDFQINVLSEVLGIEKDKVLIDKAPNGKPFITNSDIFYNVSHSRSMICCVVSYIGRVGVDIEDIKDLNDLLGLAKTIFSDSTIKHLEFISDKDRQQKVFFTFWTLLESTLKLNGIGLSYDSISNFEFDTEFGLIFYPADIINKEKILFTKSIYLYNSILSIAIELNMPFKNIIYEFIEYPIIHSQPFAKEYNYLL